MISLRDANITSLQFKPNLSDANEEEIEDAGFELKVEKTTSLKRKSNDENSTPKVKMFKASKPVYGICLRCKTYDLEEQMCKCEKEMKASLVKIFNSKFNQIFTSSGFDIGRKLNNLEEELTSISREHSVMDIAKEARQAFEVFTTNLTAAKFNKKVDEGSLQSFIQRIYGTDFTVHELLVVAESLKKQIETLLVEFESKNILDRVWKHLYEQLPYNSLTHHRGKFEKVIKNILEVPPVNGDASEIANLVIEEVLAVGLNNVKEDTDDASHSLLDRVWEEIKKQLPHHGLIYHPGQFEKIIQKISEENLAFEEWEIANFVIQEVLAVGLNNIEDIPASSSIIDTVCEHIKRQFTHHDLTDQRGKLEKIINNILDAQQGPISTLEIANVVIDEVLATGLNNIKDNPSCFPPLDLEEFPLAAPEQGKFHDFDCPGFSHYYIATSQYYKMLLRPTPSFRKPIENKPNSVQSIVHINNSKTLQNYNAKKIVFKEAGKV